MQKTNKKCGLCHHEMYRGGTKQQRKMNGDGTNHASCAFFRNSIMFKQHCVICKTPMFCGAYFKHCLTCDSYLHSSCNEKAFEYSCYGCKLCNNVPQKTVHVLRSRVVKNY